MLIEAQYAAADPDITVGTDAGYRPTNKPMPSRTSPISLAVTDGSPSEIANKDAGCHAVTDSRTHSNGTASKRRGNKSSDSRESAAKVFDFASPELEVGRQKLRASSVTHSEPSEIANKDAVCNAVTHSRAYSKSALIGLDLEGFKN